MTFVYANKINDLPEKYGPTIIALTDSQGTYSEGLTRDDAQKLTQHNQIVSFGTGSGGTIFEQNKRVRSLDEAVNLDNIANEFYPAMCRYHYEVNGLPDLLDPELDPNKLSDHIQGKLLKFMTNTYLVKKIDDQYRIFEFKLSGSPEQLKDGSLFFHKPSCRLYERNQPLIDGSGVQSLKLGSYASQTLGNNPPEFIRNPKYSKETKLYLPMLGALHTANTASISKGVNDKYQIGILNNLGYNTIFDRGVSFNDDNEALEYINSVLSTSIPNDNSALQQKLTGQRITHSIADKFFNGFLKYTDSWNQVSTIENQIKTEVISRPDLEEDLKFINNELFIPDKNDLNKSIKLLMDGEIYKLLNASSKDGKKIRELQKTFPKK